MKELFKKQVVVEELYLEKNGGIKVIHYPEKRASERYKAISINSYENTAGPTVEAAVRKMLEVLSCTASKKEKVIHSQKNILKESVKSLRDTKSKIAEAKKFLGE